MNTSPTLEYDGRALSARRGDTVLATVLANGEEHRHICGGRGFCTSCRIEVVEGTGLSAVSALERERLGAEAGKLRLACQTRILGDASVRVARFASSRFSPGGDT